MKESIAESGMISMIKNMAGSLMAWLWMLGEHEFRNFEYKFAMNTLTMKRKVPSMQSYELAISMNIKKSLPWSVKHNNIFYWKFQYFLYPEVG